MDHARAIGVVAVLLGIGGTPAAAQDLSHYRDYVLDSSVERVVAISGSRPMDVKTRHERPARIQELEWRAPYVSAGAEMADPVRTLTFVFYNDALYNITADYDRDRIAGLTTAEMVAALAATYGTPVAAPAKVTGRQVLSEDMMILAAWEDPAASVMLVRRTYSSDRQLVLVSKTLAAPATAAIKEAERLDVVEGPRRDAERRKQEEVDADAAREKARTTNKDAFRP
jgi:hypothetical protein